MRHTFPREFYIPEGSIKVTDKQSDAVAYLSINKSGKPRAVIFVGKQNKPISNYYYRSEESREAAVKTAFENNQARKARMAERRTARTDWVPTYRVGDIFHTSWGYDQTNVEYFELVEVRGKHGVFRELAQAREATGWLQGNCVPLPGDYAKPRFAGDEQGTPIRRLLQEHGIKIDDVRTAWLVKGDTIGGVRVIGASSWSAYH